MNRLARIDKKLNGQIDQDRNSPENGNRKRKERRGKGRRENKRQ